VDSCDTSIHFADAAFDMVSTGNLQEGFVCNNFSQEMLDYAVQKAGKVGIGIAKGVGKGLVNIVTEPVQRALSGDIVGVASYAYAPLRKCYNIYTLVHGLVTTLATEESRTGFWDACKKFTELPLEEQAEYTAEFLTTLIGPSQLKRIPALQRACVSLQRVSQNQVKNLTDTLTRKMVPLNSVIDAKNLGELGAVKIPKMAAQYLADKQEILGRALTKEEVASAQHFFHRTQELVHAPVSSGLAAETERLLKYANQYGESRVLEILKGKKLGKGIADTVHGAIAESSFKASKKAYKHLFLPQKNWKGTKGTGWHLPRNYPELITEVTKHPNKYGVYEALWKAPGAVIDKRSTFGPDIWNRVDFMKHARHAYSNLTGSKLQRNGRHQLKGIDKLGIEWAIIVERKGLVDKLVSVYPVLPDIE